MQAALPTHPRLVRFSRWMLGRFGWTVKFDGLPGPRGVAVVYPHTSNWDLVLCLLAKWAVDRPFRWIGKESLFRGATGATLGRVLRRWGGRPVDRHNKSGAVEQLARLMQAEPWFWLGISPEGTRDHTDHIRSGFYHLALRLDIPVGLVYLDYARREIGLVDFRRMSGDLERDLEDLRAFYANVVGRFPEQASRIEFKDRDAEPGAHPVETTGVVN